MDYQISQDQLNNYLADYRAYSKDLLKIQTMEGGLIPMDYNDPQTVFNEILDDIKAKGRPVRVVALKARRQGFSTDVAARFFQRAATRRNHYAMVISSEPDSSEFLFGMYKRFYNHLHPEMKPVTKANNKRMLEFNTPDGRGLDSAIRVATAGKEDVGAGQLIHSLHLSELAKYPRHVTEGLLTSVVQCVPNTLDSEIIIESTALGIGGEFHRRYLDCRYKYVIYIAEDRSIKFRVEINENADPANEWSSVFVPWFVFKKYSMAMPSGASMELTEEEKEYKKLYNVSNQQIMWYRWCLANNCGGSRLSRSQEYPGNDIECFLSSGDPVFPAQTLIKNMAACVEPKVRYDCQISTGQWIAEKAGKLRVWEEPAPGEAYLLAIDVAEGLEKGDFSVIDVINHLTGKQVAQWYGKTAPDILAEIAAALGKRYNLGWIVPERNNHGNTVVLKLFDMNYPKLYVERVPDPPNKPRKRYGWVTSRATKPQIIDNLAAEIREGTSGIVCKDTFREMLGFKRGADGEMEADTNELDDRVMSISIAKFVRSRIPLPGTQRAKPTWERAAKKRETPSMRAWV